MNPALSSLGYSFEEHSISSSSNSSIVGKDPFRSFGRDSTSWVWYPVTPIGLFMSLSAYSATNLSLLLHNKSPAARKVYRQFDGLGQFDSIHFRLSFGHTKV
jgi:hypothetical protein